MAKDRPVAGHECSIWYDSANSTASPTWVAITQAQNVSEPSSMEKVDASSKASKRKRAIAGQEDADLDFEYLYIQGGEDEVFNFLQDKYHTREPIHLATADSEDVEEAGALYQRDWYTILKFESGQDQNGAKVYKVGCSPAPHFTAGVLDEMSYEFVD